MSADKDALWHRRMLALAALFQSAGLAAELARTGRCDSEAEAFLLRSVLVLDSDDPAVIYPSLDGLRPGLRWLEGCLMEPGKGVAHGAEIIRLALAMVQVESHLANAPDIAGNLRQRLQNLLRQRELQGDEGTANLTLPLGSAYVDTLGKLPFRVQIRGDASQLKAAGMAERIRAILLAGIRAAWLWDRLGGRRWHLIVFRSRLLRIVRATAKTV